MSFRPEFLLAPLVVSLAFACPVAAAAPDTAKTTASVNVRAGPDKSLPTVTWLLSGTPVTVIGCTSNWRWCDVAAGRDRGWVYARFLAVPFEGSAVTIVDRGPALGLPQAEFALGPYWDEHYRTQRWYAQKPQWQERWDRRPPPPAWREPSSR